MTPARVLRTMAPAEDVRSYWVNHRLPSAPEAMAPSDEPFGPAGTGRLVAAPAVVMRPSDPPPVYHSAPSGPAAIDTGAPTGLGKEVSAPLVVARQMRRSNESVNHSAPSEP